MITDTLLCTTVHLPPRFLGGGLRVPIAIFSMVLVDIMISHDLMRRMNKRTHSYTFCLIGVQPKACTPMLLQRELNVLLKI